MGNQFIYYARFIFAIFVVSSLALPIFFTIGFAMMGALKRDGMLAETLYEFMIKGDLLLIGFIIGGILLFIPVLIATVIIRIITKNMGNFASQIVLLVGAVITGLLLYLAFIYFAVLSNPSTSRDIYSSAVTLFPIAMITIILSAAIGHLLAPKRRGAMAVSPA